METIEGKPRLTEGPLRSHILQAAGELFATHGYERTSMRKIADRIGYSPTTIYLYFRDKADLLHCLCAETFGSLTRKLKELDEPGTDPVERLKLACRAYIEFGIDHPNHYRATYMTPDRDQIKPAEKDSIVAAGMEAYEYLRRGVQDCIDTGRFACRDADAASQALWAAMHGLTSFLVAKCQFEWAARDLLIDTLVGSMIGGLSLPLSASLAAAIRPTPAVMTAGAPPSSSAPGAGS